MSEKEQKPPVPKDQLFDPFVDGTGKKKVGPDNWRDIPPPKLNEEEGKDTEK